MPRITLRKLIPKIYSGLKAAIMYCALHGGIDVEGLILDILNVFNHCIGKHTNCRAYFCRREDEPEKSIIFENATDLVNAVDRILQNLAANAERLKHGLTTNKAENFFSIVAKMILGKRENLCGRGNYALRVLFSILLYNEGYSWPSKWMQKFTGKTTNKNFQKYAEQRDKQRVYTAKSAQRPEASQKRYNRPEEKCYGENKQPVISDTIMSNKKQQYQVRFRTGTVISCIYNLFIFSDI